MMSLKNEKVKKSTKRSSIVSIVTLLTFLLTFNNALALRNIDNPNQKVPGPDLQQKYRIVVKLNTETASQAEASIGKKDMEIQKSSPKKMKELFSKYKIKKMAPVYKGLIKWKKETGKEEKDFIMKVRNDFPKRSQRNHAERNRTAMNNAPTGISNTYVIDADVNSEKEYKELLESLKRDSRFEYAEPDMTVTAEMIPNDPYFSSSGTWGQSYDDLYGLKITSCPEAWDTASGNGITVAVTDTGIDNTHPDIVSNIWTNTGEIANNGIDDDNNGYIDDTFGWDFLNNDNNPVDDNGHGTHVAGTIAATGNNGTGIIGVAPSAKVMAIKGLGSDGNGDVSKLSEGILYAARNGADIINASWGGNGYSQVLKEAVDFASSMGVVFVAAAGNNNADAMLHAPSNLNNVIAVAAVDSQDIKADFSNWGSRIDVAAPGVDILSLRAAGTSKGNPVGANYTRLSGTSMAAPHVSGVAALILSHHPDFSNDQVRSVLRCSAADIMSSGFDYATGYGRVNAVKALSINDTLLSDIESPASEDTLTGSVPVTGSAGGNNFSSYTLEYGKIIESGVEPTVWNTIAQGSTPVDKGLFGYFDTTTLVDGKYVIRLSVKDSSVPQNTFYDRIEVAIDQIKISSPATSLDPSYASEIKAGTVIPVQGKALGQTFQCYRMEWAEGLNPTQWFTSGFTLENGGNTPVDQGLLASWNSGVYPGRAGYYQLRLLVDNNGYTNEERTIIYLEPDLASANWPKKLDDPIPNHSGVLPAYNWTGQSSLVGVGSVTNKRASFIKYSYDGVLQYTSPFTSWPNGNLAVGDIDNYPGDESVFVKDGNIRILKSDYSYNESPLNTQYDFTTDPVVLQDLDGDYIPEILVVGTHLNSRTRYLYAFKTDGSLLSSNFPIPIPDIIFVHPWFTHYLVMDINNDGLKEIITQQCDNTARSTLNLYGWNGTPMLWQTVQPSFPNAAICNMIGGDLDRDGQGEIILGVGGLADGEFTSDQKMYVIGSDGSVKNGWPYSLPEEYGEVGFQDIAIADMDRDGDDEIIYSQYNEINILKLDGMPLSDAWPHIRTRYFGRFSVGDINSDNFPELLIYHFETKTYTPYDGSARRLYNDYELRAVDRNAQTIQSWKVLGPGEAGVGFNNSDPVLGDFDNNGKVDIALCVGLSNNNVTESGALTVLTTNGDYNADKMDWPVSLNDPQNSSVHIAAKPLPDVTGISLNKTCTSITEGKKERLVATVEPAGANKNVTWSVYSENIADVAVVAQDGTVTANHPGMAVIRAASKVDPSKYEECTVIVTEAVSGVLLSEGFEYSSGILPDGWSVQNVEGTYGEWRIASSGTNPDPGSPKSGSNMVKFNYGHIPRGSARMYTTSGISLGNGSYSLDFWMYHDTEIANADYIQVQVSTDEGYSWINIGSQIDRNDGSTGWKKHSISLDGYKGVSDLRVAFLGVSRSYYNMYLDDISITDTSIVNVPVTGIGIDKTSVTMTAGQTEQLVAMAAPQNATNKNIIWAVVSQSAHNVAVVSSEGLVTANNPGTAVIRAVSSTDAAMYAECTVTVNPVIIPVTGVSLNKTSVSIAAGQTEQLIAEVAPQNATDKNVTWSVYSQSTSNVVVVSSEGLVTANNPGTAVIRAVSYSDPEKYAECMVTVTAPEPVTVTLLSEGFESGGGSIPAGWAVQDVNGTYGEWSFVSSGTYPNPGGPKTGVYMAKFNSFDVNPGQSTRLYRTSGINLGSVDTYFVDFWMYHDADNTKPDSIQVQVSADGGSTWVNTGNAVNRYDSTPGWKKHTVNLDSFKGASDLRIAFLAEGRYGRNIYLDDISVVGSPVIVPVTEISLNRMYLNASVGATAQMIATALPQNATNKDVIWSVHSQSASNVAVVSSAGFVTLNNAGTAVIRAASATDPSKYAECIVTVSP